MKPAIKQLLLNPVLLWTLIGGMVIATLLRPRSKPLLDPKTRAELDSLRTTAQRHELLKDSLARLSRAAALQAEQLNTRARSLERASLIASKRADSLAKAAETIESSLASQSTLSDSLDAWRRTAGTWKAAYTAEHTSTDSLRTALAVKDSVDRSRVIQIAAITESRDSSEARLQRSTKTLADVEAAVKKAERGCRVPLTFGLLPCPSRGQALAAGGVIGTLVTLVVTK